MLSLPASMKRIRSRTAEKKWRHHFSHYKPMRIFSDTVFSIIALSVTMETSGWIWPNFKLIQALMYVIITCKYEKDQIKNSREIVEISFFPLSAYGDYSDAQGQLTPQSMVQSGQNSNLFELSCMSLLPASMKRNG